ncbi:histone-lysine N-methyltransferase SETMAR-like [Stegodyphus dumicola]|uniref:histone-lysine N-methyltransferase SETMAR-like n=1 Tax=Stegodyphus dumicola TaxID=202533 RepID=UPI0015AA2864|nr:histone-lysine N-methyltransferase SETMAR-like [Stegodyphus dumicola]
MVLKGNKIEPFLERIIIGNEKWKKYENIKRKRSWSKASDLPQTTSKPGLSLNKVILSVWWYWKGIVHYKLLQLGETINLALYCAQRDCLNEANQKERPELANRKDVVLHHDNARPHTSLMTRNKLTELGC